MKDLQEMFFTGEFADAPCYVLDRSNRKKKDLQEMFFIGEVVDDPYGSLSSSSALCF